MRRVAGGGSWPRRLAAAAVALAVAAASHGQVKPTPDGATPVAGTDDRVVRRFSLGLSVQLLESPREAAGERFTLGTVDRAPAGTETVAVQPGKPLQLTLSTETAGGRSTLPGLDRDFFDTLAEQRWPDGVTRMEKCLAAEQARIFEGGMVGLYGDDPSAMRTLDLVALGRLVTTWWSSRRARRLPTGALLARDHELTLRVRDVDGRSPGHISVVPLTQGWVGDAVHARCDGRGRCVVAGMPAGGSTLLVRGTGARVVRWDLLDAELTVDLKPTGRLRIEPVRRGGGCCPKVRLLEAVSGAVVPIVRWINPGREDWIHLTGAGLALELPEGRYRLETQGEHEASEDAIEVRAGETITVEVAL